MGLIVSEQQARRKGKTDSRRATMEDECARQEVQCRLSFTKLVRISSTLLSIRAFPSDCPRDARTLLSTFVLNFEFRISVGRIPEAPPVVLLSAENEARRRRPSKREFMIHPCCRAPFHYAFAITRSSRISQHLILVPI